MIDPHTERLMMGAAGAAGEKTYVDDVFSTYTDKGTGSARNIVNNIDLAGEGGLVWQKWRSGGASANDNNTSHILADTVRGTSKYLKANTIDSEFSVSAVGAFNSNGYQTGGNLTSTDNNNDKYASWTFRQQKGFFDVVTWTRGSTVYSNRRISHNLGSVPGLILIKRTNSAQNWYVYHRSLSGSASDEARKYIMKLNEPDPASYYSSGGLSSWFGVAPPSSTDFGINESQFGWANGDSFIAYVFAGGESTAATARSVELDASGDYLTAGSSSDFTMGTGDFTVECWARFDDSVDVPNANDGIFQISDTSGALKASGMDSTIVVWAYNNLFRFTANNAPVTGTIKCQEGQWQHIALVRHSGVTSLYIDGTLSKSATDTYNYNGTYIAVGGYYNTSYLFDGRISNFRVVKGTAVYTSSFRPPTEPLTNITNTKLLCCNNSSTTGSTVTPGTITANGNPTASIDSPFDDPEGFKFGEEGDQNIIKCGTYVGNGQTNEDGPFINLGWEPQFLLIKNTSAAASWAMFDTIRGIRTGGKTQTLSANQNNAEGDYTNFATVTSTGFYAGYNDAYTNSNGNTYIYMAVRRPDGYVAKPSELGTEVFNMGLGQNSTTIPNYISGFPVDMGMHRLPASTSSFTLITRLLGKTYFLTNSNAAEGTGANWATFDSNTGYITNQQNNTHQAWMWKRHASFDVVAYKGNSVQGRQIPHSMNVAPEMVWMRRRQGDNWCIGHKGLNGGTTPWNYTLALNTTGAESNSGPDRFNNTAPTAKVISVGNDGAVNNSSYDYVAYLFASVDGISKVGSYNGSATSHTITTGFQPRMVIIKEYSTSGQSWWMLDTVRGWAAGNDNGLQLNANTTQTSHDFGAPTATGFTLVGGHDGSSNVGKKYIYYAHA